MEDQKENFLLETPVYLFTLKTLENYLRSHKMHTTFSSHKIQILNEEKFQRI